MNERAMTDIYGTCWMLQLLLPFLGLVKENDAVVEAQYVGSNV